MEPITFRIDQISLNCYRIVCNDIRAKYRALSDGGIIDDIAVLYAEMERITKELDGAAQFVCGISNKSFNS